MSGFFFVVVGGLMRFVRCSVYFCSCEGVGGQGGCGIHDV